MSDVAAGGFDAGEYAVVFERAPVPMAIVSLDGHLVAGNAALSRTLGYALEDITGRHFSEFTHRDDHQLDDNGMAELFRSPGASAHIDKRFRHRDGHIIWARIHATFVVDEDGAPTYGVAVWMPLNDGDLDQRLSWLALHDPLTGAANRTLLFDRLEILLRARDRDGGGVAVLYIDIDGFKLVNDTNGHAFGDRTLAAVAARMRDAVRPHDTLARVGGDEFVVVAAVDHADEADVLAVRLAEALGEGVVVDGKPVHLGASIGTAVVTKDGTTPDEALDTADSRMYATKMGRRRGA